MTYQVDFCTKLQKSTMSELHVYLRFLTMCNINYKIVVNDDWDTIIYSTAGSGISGRCFIRGYDAIEFLAKFDKHGKMIQSFIMSHVAGYPNEFYEVYNEFEKFSKNER